MNFWWEKKRKIFYFGGWDLVSVCNDYHQKNANLYLKKDHTKINNKFKI